MVKEPVAAHRNLSIEAGTDLFGDWLVEVTYGRIGTRGRCRRYTVQDEAATRKQVRKVLQRRATAKRRTGVSYRGCELVRLGGMAIVGDDTRQAIPRFAKALSGRSPHGY
jgi:hypothetical protein